MKEVRNERVERKSRERTFAIVVGVKVERESREGMRRHDCRCKRRERDESFGCGTITSKCEDAREIKKRKRKDEIVEREEKREPLPSPRVAKVQRFGERGIDEGEREH
jgi:hypothetical protein